MNPGSDQPLTAHARPPSRQTAPHRGGASPLLILLVLFLATLLLYWFYDHSADDAAADNKAASGPVPPRVRFTHITEEAGLRFVHESGAAGEKLLPETMGGGCGFFDYDNDGLQDLLLVNSTKWPWAQGGATATHALYHNEGNGVFRDATPGSGLDVPMHGMGAAFGDVNRDGFVDIFITGVHGNKLFRNEGAGKFVDVTSAAGLAGNTNWSTSAAFVDLENDGDLDLFVCNYVLWSRELDLQQDYRLTGIGRAYGPPMQFPGAFPQLFRNDGHGVFVDISEQAGIRVRNRATGAPLAKSLGVAPVDLDKDGWIDLIVANDTVQNFVFHNEKNGTFREIGAISGIAYDPYGSARGAMGIDSGRFEDDSALGVSIGNFANEMTALYVSRQDPLIFSDEAVTQGIGHASRDFLTFGVFFFDYDLDGWLDLLVANGHIEPEIEKALPRQQYAQRPGLFWNARGFGAKSGFRLAGPQHTGPDIMQPLVGRGSAYADIDSDGDLDFIITQIGARPALFRNDQRLDRNWVRLKLKGKQSNPDAIGAVVRVETGSRTLTQQVMPTRGYLSQSELPLTFGLGQEKSVKSITIIWPGKKEQRIPSVPINALTLIEER